jgi:putative FmdB family regulatory protein
MPIHEFKCQKCGKTFEYLCLKSDDKKHAVCPACGHDKAQIQMSAFSTSGAGGVKGSCAPAGPFT